MKTMVLSRKKQRKLISRLIFNKFDFDWIPFVKSIISRLMHASGYVIISTGTEANISVYEFPQCCFVRIFP